MTLLKLPSHRKGVILQLQVVENVLDVVIERFATMTKISTYEGQIGGVTVYGLERFCV